MDDPYCQRLLLIQIFEGNNIQNLSLLLLVGSYHYNSSFAQLQEFFQTS